MNSKQESDRIECLLGEGRWMTDRCTGCKRNKQSYDSTNLYCPNCKREICRRCTISEEELKSVLFHRLLESSDRFYCTSCCQKRDQEQKIKTL
jgi:hypothetical protein